MEVLFSKVGIYSHVGQLYVPADRRNGSLMYYKEAKEGQVLEEGINEAGAMASWIAAGSAHATHGVPMIPFYIYYSMFGFQRIGDLIWAAADTRCRGFLLGATAGRTTLNGEGLQHEDGHSHVMALTVPNCRAYDPAYAYELSVILQDGMKRMYADGEDVFYYVTLYNENYAMPPMPEGAVEGILRGMYKLTTRGNPGKGKTVNLLGSGTILNGVLKAADLLAEKYGVSSNVYSVTSYQELRRDCLEAARWNQLHPDQPARKSYLAKLLDGVRGPFVAASDYMRTLPEQILPFVPGKDLLALGTDGFGRSETRENLRRFFEVDTQAVVAGALYSLAERGELDRAVVAKAVKELGIDADVPAPWTR
jgi:pyruvate dehydrogenase E1 component